MNEEKRAEIHLSLTEDGYYNMSVLNSDCEIFYFEDLTPKEVGVNLIRSLNLDPSEFEDDDED